MLDILRACNDPRELVFLLILALHHRLDDARVI